MKIVFFVFVVCANFIASSAAIIVRSERSIVDCGVPKIKTGLVVQGQNFLRGSLPWIVALMYKGFKPPRFFCGATLISKNFVISAALCILQKNSNRTLLPREVVALFGAHDLSDHFEPGRYALSPKDIFIHDKWNPETTQYDSDISLLEFEAGNIILNDYINPICLWESEPEPEVTEGTVCGWGKSENQKQFHENLPKLIKAPIQGNEDCFLEEIELVDLSSKRTFCAGLKNGSGVCHGDSGGGFFYKFHDVHYLKGIVSSSLLIGADCDVSRNAIYTNVLKFMEWIQKTTGSTPKIGAPEILGSQKVMYFIEEKISSHSGKTVNHCVIRENIVSEDRFLGPPIDTTCKTFYIRENNDVKFLPRQIGEILPKLTEFQAANCGLTIVRDFYFKNMRELRFLNLKDNVIFFIEPTAFEDLVKLETLWLNDNLIGTLDEKLFASMISLKHITLTSNKIKFLSPETFKIPGGSLELVNLGENICIHQVYNTADLLNELALDLSTNCSSNATELTSQDLKNVICLYDQPYSNNLNREARRCFVDQKIVSEDYFFLKEPIRSDVEIFLIGRHKYVKFFPKQVGDKFPNLRELIVDNCGLTIIRDFYFKNMRNLKFLYVNFHKIATIEPEAFNDLVNVEKLWLHDNLIETLDEKLLASMKNLEEIFLNNNRIKFLSPVTFKIPDGSLRFVDLRGNACIGKNYPSDGDKFDSNKLESDLRAECSQN